MFSDLLTRGRRRAALLLVALLLPIALRAQTSVVIASGSTVSGAGGDLVVGGSWNNQGTFQPGTGSVTFAGGDAATITDASGAATFNVLRVDKTGGTLALNAPVTVTQALALAGGTLDNSAQGVTLAPTATLVPAGGQVAQTPTFTGPVEITYGGTDPVVTGTELPATVDRLTIANPAGVTLTRSLTIGDSLVVTAGSLLLGGSVVTLDADAGLREADGATVVGASGYLETTRVLNAPSGQIAGLGIAINSAANLGSTTVRRGHAPQTGTGLQIAERYFDILPSNNSGLDATLAFSYDEDELNGISETNLTLLRSTDNGATWTVRGGTANPANNTVTLSGIDAFSRWSVGQEAQALTASALLAGAYNGTDMNTALSAVLPQTDPYVGTASVAAADFFTATPAGQRVVDWVLVKLLSGSPASPPMAVVATAPALLLDDGSIVGVDGTGALIIPAPAGTYHVVVQHRNHLAVMSASPVTFAAGAGAWNFTTAAGQAYGTDALQSLAGGRFGLWPGDATGNGQVKYSGAGNDRGLLLTRTVTLTGTAAGYFPEDLNLNGQVKYSGAGNDRGVILQTTGTLTGTRTTQVPAH